MIVGHSAICSTAVKRRATEFLLKKDLIRNTRQSGNLQLSTVCGIIAPISWTMMIAIESLLRPGYSQISNYISDLGVGPHAILQNANFWSFGALVFIFSLGLGHSLPRSKAVVITLCLFGVGIFLAGAFPETPIPPGRHTNLHDLAGDLAFPSIVFCQFFFWRRIRKIRESEEKGLFFWNHYKNYSLVSAVLSLVCLFVLLGAESGSPYVGLAQRLLLAVPLLWIEVIAITSLRTAKKEIVNFASQ
jgi:hypothetical membrane protein